MNYCVAFVDIPLAIYLALFYLDGLFQQEQPATFVEEKEEAVVQELGKESEAELVDILPSEEVVTAAAAAVVEPYDEIETTVVFKSAKNVKSAKYDNQAQKKDCNWEGVFIGCIAVLFFFAIAIVFFFVVFKKKNSSQKTKQIPPPEDDIHIIKPSNTHETSDSSTDDESSKASTP